MQGLENVAWRLWETPGGVYMLSSLPLPHSSDNRTPVPHCIVVCLVDKLGDVYDVRGVFPGDVGALSDEAQRVTDGQMWWETLDRIQDSATALYAAHDAIELALMSADFIPGELA